MMLDPKHAENSPRAEVLRYIQHNGSASIKDLEAALHVTTTAVREQVERLLREGFLQTTRVRGEVGRPYYVYSLSTKAQELFPKDYATLAVLMLEETLAMNGPEGLSALLNRVSARMVEKLNPHTRAEDLSQKLVGLVAALGDTGMEVSMVPVTAEQEGGETQPDFLLRTHTCPYFDVARTHREVCEMEQDMLSELLGPGVDVKLGNCIIDGKHACEFHVMRVAPNAEEKQHIVTSAGLPE